MWPSPGQQFPSSSALQPLEDEQDHNVGTLQLRSTWVEQLSGDVSGQESFRGGPQRTNRQSLRWQPYSAANLFQSSEHQAENANSSDQRLNTSFPSCAKRLKRGLGLTRVQSSPEFDLRRVDMPSRKRHNEDSPSRTGSFGPPITKSKSEDEVNEVHSPILSKKFKENEKPLSMDSNILSGFRKMTQTFSPHTCGIAKRLIRHARKHKVLHECTVWCRNCDRIPVNPVTGSCGHTRCKTCVERTGACPCGAQAYAEVSVDVVAQQIMDKMFKECYASDMNSFRTSKYTRKRYEGAASTSATDNLCGSSADTEALVPSEIPRNLLKTAKAKKIALSPHVPMTPQVRYKYARSLISAGQLKEAVAHLARVAAYNDHPIAHSACPLLIRTLNMLLQHSGPLTLTRQLNRLVRSHATSGWLRGADLECTLCLTPYTQPVTTPCGHTFCRHCIERLMDYQKPCALCKRPLYDFDLSITKESLFTSAALVAINEGKPLPRLEKDVIYIVVCTVAYPKVPCPLIIFDPRYWSMIRRVLKTGRRKFGMVALDDDGHQSNYGTILEVRDCVLMENGSFLLSTVGLTRFRVVETDTRYGCDVARIVKVADNIPTEPSAILKVQNISWITRLRAVHWLHHVSPATLDSIILTFGVLPQLDDSNDTFWETSDGPDWLWWFIAILPLRIEIKILVLSTKCVLKRLMALNRVLDSMNNIPDIESSLD